MIRKGLAVAFVVAMFVFAPIGSALATDIVGNCNNGCLDPSPDNTSEVCIASDKVINGTTYAANVCVFDHAWLTMSGMKADGRLLVCPSNIYACAVTKINVLHIRFYVWNGSKYVLQESSSQGIVDASHNSLYTTSDYAAGCTLDVRSYTEIDYKLKWSDPAGTWSTEKIYRSNVYNHQALC